MIAVYEFDLVGLCWLRTAVFALEVDADFYIMMKRRYTKNLRIKKEVLYHG